MRRGVAFTLHSRLNYSTGVFSYSRNDEKRLARRSRGFDVSVLPLSVTPPDDRGGCESRRELPTLEGWLIYSTTTSQPHHKHLHSRNWCIVLISGTRILHLRIGYYTKYTFKKYIWNQVIIFCLFHWFTSSCFMLLFTCL